MSVENILEMRSVVKQFPGVRALDNVELELRKGEVLALVGENGAGKSTLMRVLLGIYRPTSGSITFKGQPFAPMSPMDALRSGISMIHQEITLVPTMTVAENIWLGREDKFSSCGFLNTKKRERAAQELLARFDLDIQSHALVSSLSVANMQLVEIIRAISYSSDVIIMDVSLGAMSGVEATRRILADGSRAKVIGLSMHLDGEVAQAMREAGAIAYLTKDGPTEELIATVRACRRARCRAGIRIAISSAITAMTTSSSIRVKAWGWIIDD